LNASDKKPLRYRIKAKSAQLREELALLEGVEVSVTEKCNGVTEFCNGNQNQISSNQAAFGVGMVRSLGSVPTSLLAYLQTIVFSRQQPRLSFLAYPSRQV